MTYSYSAGAKPKSCLFPVEISPFVATMSYRANYIFSIPHQEIS